ncbi:putative ribonuclease H-like domain-containing protein [Tanacetum coccineum]
MDVKSAFLYGKIEEEVYVCQPPGFEDPDFPDRILCIGDMDYKEGKLTRPYSSKGTRCILMVQVYVDDIIFGSTKKELCNAFEKLMHEKFQMSSMGELTFFLGLQVQQKKDGIFISQDKYVEEILKKFGFTEVKTASTPMETQKPLLKDEDGEEVDVHMYRYQVNPKVSHLHAVKRIFRYLKGQPKLGLWYPKDSLFDLVAYTDSDYAGASLDRKSTTGGCQFLGCRLISWQCKKQTVVANSTTEAEYVAASSCCGQVLWIQNQLLDYGYNFMHTKIFIDNNSTICIIKNPVFHLKTKHIEIRHHFIRDCNEKKLIQMVKIYTDKNVADLLTKAFDLHALVDGKKIIITESTVRRELQLEDAEGGVPSAKKTMGDTIAQTRFENVSKLSNDSLLARGNTLRSDEDILKLNELMELCTNLQKKVLDLEKTKTSQANEIAKSSRDEDLGEDASKQGMRINAIDAYEDITLVNDDADKEMFDVDALDGEEVIVVWKNENVVEEIVDAAQIFTTATKNLSWWRVVQKRAGEELEQESTKKQKVDEDKDTTELQSLMEVIPDEEEVAIDVVPLATKSPSIVDWKIHKEGKKSYYQITMFELHVEDEIWKLQQRYKVLSWKLFDSCGVHCLSLQSGMIYMLVEKRYPLTPPTITDMLNKKLQGRIVGIKSLLNAASITAALIDVNAAQSKLVLLENFNENYSKCLRLLVKLQLLVHS